MQKPFVPWPSAKVEAFSIYLASETKYRKINDETKYKLKISLRQPKSEATSHRAPLNTIFSQAIHNPRFIHTLRVSQ